MNCFFHNRNWDFAWIGGQNAMRMWVYPVREFSTADERGLHRNVTSIAPEFASWRERRAITLSNEDCVKILRACECHGNDLQGEWLETHMQTKQVTRWKPVSGTVGSEGRFESELGGPNWQASFMDGVFVPDKPLLGAQPVKRVSATKCIAPTWCKHGSSFEFKHNVHWRSEQYCRVIRNMQLNGCAFGFGDKRGEFFNLRRDA
jgi:hypothetical protein